MSEVLSSFSNELSLLKRNIASRLGFPLANQQGYYFLPNILSTDNFNALQNTLFTHKQQFFRQNSFFRKGAAFDAHSLRKSPCSSVVDSLIQDSFLQNVKDRITKPTLQYAPEGDSNLISLLYYGTAGDGIDWHFDGNIYLGERWAGILTFQEDTNDSHSKLELEIQGEQKNFAKENILNSLILFQGDQIKHRVRPMLRGEERMVINLLFTTNPAHSKNPLLRGYQSLVNYFFYGKLQSGLQDKKREI